MGLGERCNLIIFLRIMMTKYKAAPFVDGMVMAQILARRYAIPLHTAPLRALNQSSCYAHGSTC